MKYKVKFRINAPGGKKAKFSINIEEGASYSIQPKALGLDDLTSVLAILKVEQGRVNVFLGDSDEWIVSLNGGGKPNRAVRIGDFIAMGPYALEFLEVPMPAEEQANENATRFIDISEAVPKTAVSEVIKEPAKEAVKEVTKEPTKEVSKKTGKAKTNPKQKALTQVNTATVVGVSSSSNKDKKAKKHKLSKREARRLKRKKLNPESSLRLDVQAEHSHKSKKIELEKKSEAEERIEANTEKTPTGSDSVSVLQSDQPSDLHSNLHTHSHTKQKESALRFDHTADSTSMRTALPGVQKMRWAAAAAAVVGVAFIFHFSRSEKKPLVPVDGEVTREPAASEKTISQTDDVAPIPPAGDTGESALDREQAPPNQQELSKELQGLKFVWVPQKPAAQSSGNPEQPPSVSSGAGYEPSTGSKVKDQFFVAIKSGDLPIVQKMVSQRRVDLNFTLERGRTPLMIASQRGQMKVIKYLVSQRVNLDARDPDGTTALMLAVHRGHSDVVAFLVQKGANATLRRDDGDRAIDIARRWNYAEIVRTLKYAEHVQRPANRAVAGKRSR